MGIKTQWHDAIEEEQQVRLLKALRKTFGSTQRSAMTRETHPSIMERYARVCKETQTPQRQVVIILSQTPSVLLTGGTIYVSSRLIRKLSPEEMSALLGGETANMTRKPALLDVDLFLFTPSVSVLPVEEDAGLKARTQDAVAEDIAFADPILQLPADLFGLALSA